MRHVRGAKYEGSDTLWNIEQLQFGKDLFALKKNGLTFQTDFALVVDTSGSMGSSIASLQAKATALIDTLFADGKIDARVGIVGFKDASNGEPSTVVLPFTEQDQFADRKAAAVAAIKGLAASGGGDVPETSFDGLLKALDGSMGKWRAGAGTRRIVLLTDAPPKDSALEQTVRTYAQSIGASVEGSSGKMSSEGSLTTFDLAFPQAQSGTASLALPDDGEPLPEFTFIDEPVDPDTSVTTLEIYTIFTGSKVVDTADLAALSSSTGGLLLSAADGDDVVSVLLDIIGGLDLVGTPEADSLTGGIHIDKLTGLEGDDSLDGGGNADTMIGGPGGDRYFVDHPKDSVVELSGEGTDEVTTSLTFYVLPDNVENGVVSGAAGAILTGNGLANALIGGAGDDFVIGLAGDDLLEGSDGDDTLLGGQPSPGQGLGQLVVGVGAANDSIGAAIDLSNLLSLADDPDILDATTVPHVSIGGKGDGTLHYYAITLDNVGDVLTVDVDHTNGFDSYVSILAADSSVLASGDDASITLGAGGSTSSRDAFLQYTSKAAGTHYVVIGRFARDLAGDGGPDGPEGAAILLSGDSYELQVSVEVAAPPGVFASGDDTLGGGLGADLLFGGDGLDTFTGTPAELDGDHVGDYETGEKIVVAGIAFGDVEVSWGKGSKAIEIDVTGDGIAEASVTLDVAPDDLILAGLQLAVLPAGDGTDTSIAFVTPPTVPVASIAALSSDLAEGDAATTPFTFEVTLSEPSDSEGTVSWTVSGRGGTPADAADFTGGVLPSSVVTFAAGETSKVVTVDALGDSAVESNEGFSVFLTGTSPGLTLGAAIATGTILNDDRSVVSISGPSATSPEGDSGTTAFTFTVSLDQPGVSGQTIDWSVAGTGGQAADAADFGGVVPAGSVSFAAGESSKQITVAVSGDGEVEPDETFSVTLSSPSAGLVLGAASATATIGNDDSAPTVVAHADAYISLEGQALVTTLPSGLLANDEHASTASLLSGPAHGTLQLVGSGTFTYAPEAGFHGIDTFTYQAGNSGPTLDEAEVTIHVVPVNVGASTTLDLLALTAEEQIAATYAVFFGRGADLLGFDFWVGEFVQGLPAQGPATLFANIASSFGISDEAKGLYPFLADPFGASDGEITAFLESVYDNLFDRASDAAGLAYWTGQVKATLQAGQFVGSVLVNIMSGAQDTAAGQDITTLMGKVAVSLAYVREQEEHSTVWLGASDIAAATALLEAVTSDPASVLVGVREAESLIAAHA